MVQEFLTYLALGIALVFIYQKFFGTRAAGKRSGAKKKSKKDCGEDDCGCH